MIMATVCAVSTTPLEVVTAHLQKNNTYSRWLATIFAKWAKEALPCLVCCSSYEKKGSHHPLYSNRSCSTYSRTYNNRYAVFNVCYVVQTM